MLQNAHNKAVELPWLIGDPFSLASRLSGLSIAYGSTVLELDVEVDSRLQSKRIKAKSWTAANQSVMDVDASEPSLPMAGNLPAADLAKVLGDDVSEIWHAGALGEPELQNWADARLLRMRLARIRGRARCQGFAKILPDNLFEVTGIGERFEGTLYASGVRHSVSGGNWETDVQFGLSPELFTETYDLRPLPAAGLLPVVSGLQMGLVTALEMTIVDIAAQAVEDYLAKRRDGGMSKQTSNHYRHSIHQFCRWLHKRSLIKTNPIAEIPKLNVDTDRRHDRRALTVDEFPTIGGGGRGRQARRGN